jgi:hypothetical protein
METIAKDPFLPPFTSLYVGEIIDEAEAQEYVILVRLVKARRLLKQRKH